MVSRLNGPVTVRVFIGVLLALVVFFGIGAIVAIAVTRDDGAGETRTVTATTTVVSGR